MAAEKLGLSDRGVLAAGKAADITIFDAATVGDKATFDAPHQYPEGIDYVIVNGQVVVEHGQQYPVLPGMILKK
jgi:N-acyl-D-aspartate/D-glutamate deacylase